MTDWKALAAARRPDVPPDAVDRIAPALNALDADFRPLVSLLTPEILPATEFRPEPHAND